MRSHALMMVVGGALYVGCAESGRPVSGGAWIGTPISARPAPTPTPPVEATPADDPAEAADDAPAELPRPVPMALGAGLPPIAAPAGEAVPGDAEVVALIEQARAMASAGDFEGAIATLRRASARAPKDPAVALAEGRIHQGAGRHADAVTAFRRARGRGEPTAEGLYGEAYALLQLGRAGEATGLVDALARLRPGDVQVERLRAAVLAGGGDIDGSLQARARLAEKEDGVAARRELGDALARAGRHAEAADAFERAAAAAPDDAALHLRLGTARGLAGDLAGAERALATSTRLAPGDPAGWQALARVRQQRGDRAGAADALEALLDRAGGSDDAAVRARIERLRAPAGEE